MFAWVDYDESAFPIQSGNCSGKKVQPEQTRGYFAFISCFSAWVTAAPRFMVSATNVRTICML